MATLITWLIAGGFFSLYLTSERKDYDSPLPVAKLMKIQPRLPDAVGISVLFLALLLAINHFGLGSGILFFFIALMTTGSLVVILAPLRIFNYRVLLPAIACSIILEFIF